MVDLYCASFREIPKRITLDIDDTFDAVSKIFNHRVCLALLILIWY